MTLIQLLVPMGELAATGPRSMDGLVRIEQPIGHCQPDERPDQRLARGGRLEPVRAITPRMKQVATTRQDSAPVAAAVVLAAEVRSARMQSRWWSVLSMLW